MLELFFIDLHLRVINFGIEKVANW